MAEYSKGPEPSRLRPCREPMALQPENCTSLGQDHPWPPTSGQRYCLRGPQVEPEASSWICPPHPLCVVTLEQLRDPQHGCTLPPYPTDAGILADEIAELIELSQLRDDPEAVASQNPNRPRRQISRFLRLRPLPFGAVFNQDRDPELPLIMTGRELARLFESETPGLLHRHALNYLILQENISPPRQARIWAALDIAIYSALLAAWYFKWCGGAGVAYRRRPIEFDYRVNVLYNHEVNSRGSADDGRRLLPDPSPGTPRHPAYPSGHSTYSAAASELLSYFFPDYTADFDDLADNTGLARLWAGIHWRSDHECGARLGRCVARIIIGQLQNDGVAPLFDRPCQPIDYCEMPPKPGSLPCCRNRTGEPVAPPAEPKQPTRKAGEMTESAEKETAQSPQKGAPGSVASEAMRKQAKGPQKGAPGSSREQEDTGRAKGPQKGGR